MHIPSLNILRVALVVVLTIACSGAAWADDYEDVAQLMRNGRGADAMARIQQFLLTRPRDPQMRFSKGLIERDSGKSAEAIATFLALTQDYPELPEAHNNLAVLYAAQNELDKARLALEAAVRNNPQFGIALENLGDVHLRLAAQAYDRARSTDVTQSGPARKLQLLQPLLNPPPPSGAR
jgi:tetratricopeptide (TPR) repeat protein